MTKSLSLLSQAAAGGDTEEVGTSFCAGDGEKVGVGSQESESKE